MNRKIALVTGASSGIGRSVALGLLDAGYRVVLAARNAAALDSVVEEAGPDAASRTLSVSCDVSDSESVRRLFESIETKWERLDLLFSI